MTEPSASHAQDGRDSSKHLVVFANVKGNLGDFAILQSMIDAIVRKHPGATIDVASHGQHVQDTLRFEAFRDSSANKFQYVGKLPFQRPSKLLSIPRRLGFQHKVAQGFVDRLRRAYSAHPLIKTFGSYDAIHFAGGEQFGGFANSATMLAVLSLAIEAKRRVFLHPFSVKTRFPEIYGAAYLGSLFNALDGEIVVRDSASFDTMKGICKSVVLGRDAVFSLVSEATPRTVDPAGKAKTRPRVALAITKSPGSPATALETLARSLGAAGLDVFLFSTCEREDGDALRRLETGGAGRSVMPVTWQDAVAQIQSVDLVITNRLHCLIFGCLAGTPVVPILNREKMRGISHDIGLPVRIEQASDADFALFEQAAVVLRDEIIARQTAYVSATQSDVS